MLSFSSVQNRGNKTRLMLPVLSFELARMRNWTRLPQNKLCSPLLSHFHHVLFFSLRSVHLAFPAILKQGLTVNGYFDLKRGFSYKAIFTNLIVLLTAYDRFKLVSHRSYKEHLNSSNSPSYQVRAIGADGKGKDLSNNASSIG